MKAMCLYNTDKKHLLVYCGNVKDVNDVILELHDVEYPVANEVIRAFELMNMRIQNVR